MVRNYKDLRVWQLSYDLLLDIYPILRDLPDLERHNIVHQLRRSATSIPLNIAEGCGSRTTKMFLNHLSFAYQETNEVEVLLRLCGDLCYVEADVLAVLLDNLEKLKIALFRLIKSIEEDMRKFRKGPIPVS